MGSYIVTIARQYGSNGREVGQKLAEISGYKFYALVWLYRSICCC